MTWLQKGPLSICLYSSTLLGLRVIWIHCAQCLEYHMESTANTDINMSPSGNDFPCHIAAKGRDIWKGKILNMSKSFSSSSKSHTQECGLWLCASADTILSVFFPLKNSMQELHILKWFFKGGRVSGKDEFWCFHVSSQCFCPKPLIVPGWQIFL